MLFHTWLFVLFFLVFYPVYLVARGGRLEFLWLLLASYLFYASWNPVFLVLIIYSTLVDYFVVARMEGSRRRGLWLALGVANHLGLLGFFKYSGFLVRNLNALLHALGIPYGIPDPNRVLAHVNVVVDWLNHLLGRLGIPHHLQAQTTLLVVGISFYTFQSISYIVDCYRGHATRERNFLRYAAYVCFFPQLVAGPIERAGNLLRQFREKRSIAAQDIADGLSLFVVGFFKKVALADFLSLYVDKVYAAPGQFQAPALALATFAFGWQIYFDFAGYTDMARGIARLLGIRIMLNFNNPYLADSLGDFWARWHISLSTWFRDYVYIPLGGNRAGRFATYRNMCLTMLLSGFWHGAAWTFLIWGALHAAGRVLTRELERTALYRDRVPRLAKQLGVFAFVTFAWIFFRARSLGDAWLVVRGLVAGGWGDPGFPLLALGLVLAVWVYQFVYESRGRWLVELAPVRVGIVAFAVLYAALFTAPGAQAFIYFQF